jgi:acetyltransferase-like isoleucine patch superfamily enzyme
VKKEVKELLTRDLSGLRDRFFLWLANKLPGFEVLDIFARPPLLRLAGVQVYGWNMIYRPFSIKFPRQLRVLGGVCINEGCRLDAEGGIELAVNAWMGPQCTVETVHHRPLPHRTKEFRPVKIGAGVWIGSRVTLVPGVTIGAGAVLAAGSVVTRNVPPGQLWGGNPAGFIKNLS